MKHARTHHAGEQIVPEAFDLHVLLADQPEEDKHVGTYAELDKLPGIFLPSRRQRRPDPEAEANVGEVEQEEQVARCQPQGKGNHLENDEQDNGGFEFFH